MEQETKNLRIHGVVQGVGYRLWAKQQADLMRLDGWVRNRRNDKSVEICVTSDEDTLQKFISACYQGSKNAKVSVIHVVNGVDEDISGFEIRDTAP
ncbi:MAG: acylphosphatase [Alphaproteobacteria bacterium]